MQNSVARLRIRHIADQFAAGLMERITSMEQKQARVIDSAHPFYGLTVYVDEWVDGVYRISEVGADWHTGYARPEQLEFL